MRRLAGYWFGWAMGVSEGAPDAVSGHAATGIHSSLPFSSLLNGVHSSLPFSSGVLLRPCINSGQPPRIPFSSLVACNTAGRLVCSTTRPMANPADRCCQRDYFLNVLCNLHLCSAITPACCRHLNVVQALHPDPISTCCGEAWATREA